MKTIKFQRSAGPFDNPGAGVLAHILARLRRVRLGDQLEVSGDRRAHIEVCDAVFVNLYNI